MTKMTTLSENLSGMPCYGFQMCVLFLSVCCDVCDERRLHRSETLVFSSGEDVARALVRRGQLRSVM